MTEYSANYLREKYAELGYDEVMPYYEFVDRVANGQLAIDDERPKGENNESLSRT
jgi:spore maturation protein CgeB